MFGHTDVLGEEILPDGLTHLIHPHVARTARAEQTPQDEVHGIQVWELVPNDVEFLRLRYELSELLRREG